MIKFYKFDIFSPVYYFSAFLFLYVPVKLLIIYAGYSKYQWNHFEDIGLVLFLTILYIVNIYFGYFLFVNKNYRKFYLSVNRVFAFESSRVKNLLPKLLILTAIVLFLYELYLNLIGYSLFQYNADSAIQVKLAAETNPLARIFIKGFADNIIILLIYILSYFSIVEKKHRLILFSYVLLVFFIGTLTGSRGMLVFFGILPMLIIYNTFQSRISLVKVFVVFFCILFIVGFVGIIRTQQAGLTISSMLATLSDPMLVEYISIQIDRRVDSYFPNLFILFSDIERYEFRYGFDYISAFLQHIPRFVFAEKPDSFVREFNNNSQVLSSGGVGLPPLAEAWVNFGVFGVIVQSFLAGVLLAVFQKIYIYAKRDKNLGVIICLVILGYSIAYSLIIAPGITHGTPELTFAIVKYFVIFWVVRRIMYA